MPFDKLTQHTLGLFHGLPAWWKKHQAELARQRDPSDGEHDGPGPDSERQVTSSEVARGISDGGFVGRGGSGAAMGVGHHIGHSGAAGAGGNLAWRRPGTGFGSGHEEAHHGVGDHPMNSPSARGGLGNNPAGHGLHMGQHLRGNSMAPHSPLGKKTLSSYELLFQKEKKSSAVSFADWWMAIAWNKSPFGPIAPPPSAGLVLGQPARGVISTSNPYASLSNIEESMNEESKGN